MRNFAPFLLLLPYLSYAQIQVSKYPQNGSTHFPIVNKEAAATIYVDPSENFLIRKAAEFLASDIKKVTSQRLRMGSSTDALDANIIVVGTEQNSLIQQLIQQNKLKVEVIKNQWERFIIQTIRHPFPGVDQALIIVGSDRRGAAYGVFTLSERIGVSPWHWWADVPVKKSEELYLENGRHVSEGPAVKYRGIFINDEAPALRNWAQEKFGGFNHLFYEKVFELILRNKGNYLWPAMWLPSVFNEDDPLNPKLANDYGIVISTSHHEPMMRSHNEWHQFGGGEWNYETNKQQLQEFWRGGIERMGDYESVVTVGMRGDGDKGMSEETAVTVLKTIIEDQRAILEDVTGKPAHETPQVWAVYKEVQDYYDKGLRVDDDIIVLLCDDNWGNLRILPMPADLARKARYGIYYHFDYVGGPVSYRWLNTTQIERVWEQMNLAYTHGVKDLWLVNVGDIKPMELPISFFLDYAWNPQAIQAKDIPDYYINWARQQFGEPHSEEIAELLALYTKYNARRTPEMLKPDTYSLKNYQEADRIVEEYRKLQEKSTKIFQLLPDGYKSSFYQLIHSPILMCANLNAMYVAAGKNQYYAALGAASANFYADKVKELFERDAELTRYYHEELQEGKWNHMMSQTHIGYTSWNNPPKNIMPDITYVDIEKQPKLACLPEYGTENQNSSELPLFDRINDQKFYVEILNKGEEKLSFKATAREDWLNLSHNHGTIQFDEKIYVTIDWEKAPAGTATGRITISGAGQEYVIKVPIRNNLPEVSGFIENNGVVSIGAAHFTDKVESNDTRWTEVTNLGRTNSSVIAEPVNMSRQKLNENSSRLTYDFTVFEAGELTIHSYLSPTQDFRKKDGLKYAIAIDDEAPQIINMNEGEIKPDYEHARWWGQSVGDHIKVRRSTHYVDAPGAHTLKVWLIDPGIVFQKFVLDAGGLKPSYLGPPESLFSETGPR